MILVFFSCKKNQENTHIEKWKLVKITTAWTGQSQSFDYQQYIILNRNESTFKKERWKNNQLVAQISGTYEKYYGPPMISLNYPTVNNELRESCNGATEPLMFENNQLKGSFGACDGPTLTYELAK